MDEAPTGAEPPYPDSHDILQFGPFAFDAAKNRLCRDGVEVHLTPKAATVLRHLLQRPGELITKDEFLDAVWDGVHVREESLTQAISVIRHAISDSVQQPEFIETVSGEGYRFVGEVSTVADSSVPAPNGQAQPRPRVTRTRSLTRESLAATAVVVVAIGALAWLWGPGAPPSDTSGLDPDVSPLTSFPGYENYPALSRDGRQVAFIWDAGDGLQLYVQFASGGVPVPLGSAVYGDPAWDPTGERIAFMREPLQPPEAGSSTGYEIRTITAHGTEDRPWITSSIRAGGLAWSPDGRFLAYSDRPGPGERRRVFFLELSTGDTHQVTFPEGPEATLDGSPSFSPDGSHLAFIRLRAAAGGVGYIHLQGLDDQGRPVGDSVRLASPHGFLHDLDWMADGSAVVYSGGLTDDYPYLTMIPLDGTGPSRLGVGERARDFSIAGNRLAFSERQNDVDLWRIGGPAADSPGTPEPWPSSTRDDHLPDYSPDGDRVTFISGRDGQWDVWVANADGSNPKRLSDLGHATRPRWAPDGSLIAFNVASVEGTLVYVVDPDQGAPTRITAGEFRDAIPGWSDDSRSLYFQSRGREPGPEGTLWEIWKMSRDGGSPTRITDAWGLRPVHYNGRVYVTRINDSRIVSHPDDGGEAELVVDYPINHARWDLWRGILVFMERGEPGTAVIKIFDPETDTEPRVHAVVPVVAPGWLQTEGTLTVSTDGQFILYSAKGRPGGADLIRVDNFR